MILSTNSFVLLYFFPYPWWYRRFFPSFCEVFTNNYKIAILYVCYNMGSYYSIIFSGFNWFKYLLFIKKLKLTLKLKKIIIKVHPKPRECNIKATNGPNIYANMVWRYIDASATFINRLFQQLFWKRIALDELRRSECKSI